MKAVWYESKGAARDVLQTGEMPAPQPQAGEVLVRLSVSGINPTDTKRRGGGAMEFPRIIPHQDGSGVIDAVGEGVPETRVGERIWIYEAQWERAFGTAAEYVCVPNINAVRLPDSVGLAEGACLGIAAMTAHRGIFQDGAVKDKAILVTGGAGSVGFYAVQFAKWGGASPIIATISSPEQAEVARSGGADYTIDYKKENVAARVKELTGGAGVDRIFDVSFGSNLETSVAVIKPNGVISSYSSDAVPEPKLPFWALLGKDVTIHTILVYEMPEVAHKAAVDDITKCLESGALKHQIARRFPLEETVAAHELVESGKKIGKVLIDID